MMMGTEGLWAAVDHVPQRGCEMPPEAGGPGAISIFPGDTFGSVTKLCATWQP